MLADSDADSSLDEAERIVEQPLLRETPRDLQQEERPRAATTQRDATPQSSRRPWVRRMLFLLLPLALIAGSAWYVIGGRVMYTDNAYVNADKVGISTDVAGTVVEVDVHDNQEVAAGQVLYRLDALQFVIALANAKANRAQAALTLESMKRDYRRMVTDATTEQSQVALDRTRYDRATRLLTSGVESRAGYDQAQFTLQTDQSKLEALREEARVQLARLGGNPDIPATQFPQFQQASAQVAEAEPAHLCAAWSAGQREGRHLPRSPLVRNRGEPESDGRSGILTSAGAEHERQLGQGRAAGTDAHSRRYQRCAHAAAARRHEHGGVCRHRASARVPPLPDRALLTDPS
jgi:multidrug efflux pump subunit AcrA (membrane-fusion protein)